MREKLTLKQAFDRAMACQRDGRLAEAQMLYQQILVAHPIQYEALYFLGIVHFQRNENEKALNCFNRVIAIVPRHFEPWNNRGIALCNLGRFEDAVGSFDRALAIDRNQAEAWNNRGAALQELKRLDEAVESFDRALQLKPIYAEAWNNRGATCRRLKRLEEGLENCQRALEIKSTYVKALNNVGIILCELRLFDSSLESFDKALAIAPDYAEAWNNRGNTLWEVDKFGDAVASYDKAISINQNYAEALFNRGNTRWAEYHHYQPAVADLERALELAPNYDYARGGLLHLRMHGGDWHDFERQLAALNEGVRAGQMVVEPFAYMALSESPSDLKACSIIHTRDVYPSAPSSRFHKKRHRGKIRLGYVSGEFREQATAYLTAGLYESHDKSKFETIGFDSGHSDNSPTRKRLEAAFDKIVDISRLGDRASAERINEEEIDILIDLNGYFGEHRMGVFAQRPAPIQVNYLGFPGTLGASYIDYIIADQIVIPEDEQSFYSEKVVWLPNTYQVNDASRSVVRTDCDRAQHGLPKHAFVFCSFNQGYKLTPVMFSVWMRILGRVEGSVLWILESNTEFSRNLKKEAARLGVSGDRLIFAPVIPANEHLARQTLADLFLDSLPCNAHTTASDALWAGLPLITCRGGAFAGRVAASLLHAIGLPELVVEDLQAYEALAVELATDGMRLPRIREKLARNRLTFPLFDTDRYRRDLEAAYEVMWALYSAGHPPRSFSIDASIKR